MAAEVLVDKTKLKKPPLSIHYLGDRVLRQPAKRVTKIDDELRQLVREMLQTMYSADGVGLAAPQVAVNKQVIVVDCEPNEAANPPLILVNPTLKRSSGDLEVDQEGCLSIPSVYLDVRRPSEIEVAFKDEQGRPQTLVASGFLARAIQHEMDHLNGILFVDRVENALLLTQELKKQGFTVQAVRPVK
jgi:peptide deformylase